MLKIFLSCLALFFVGCGGNPKCDSSNSKKLVMESVESSVKKQLAMKINPAVSGDEWGNILSAEEKGMVEFNYSEYGPVLENIATLKQNSGALECSAELRFRNNQKFNLFYRLQKDTNGKLHAVVEWR